jgi:hypothetical protein
MTFSIPRNTLSISGGQWLKQVLHLTHVQLLLSSNLLCWKSWTKIEIINICFRTIPCIIMHFIYWCLLGYFFAAFASQQFHDEQAECSPPIYSNACRMMTRYLAKMTHWIQQQDISLSIPVQIIQMYIQHTIFWVSCSLLVRLSVRNDKLACSCGE